MHNWWTYSLKIFCELPVKLSPMLCIASTQFTIYWKLLPGCHQATGTLLTSLASSRKVAGALNTLITSADREAVSGLQGKSLHSKLELADPGLAQRTQSRLVPTGTSHPASRWGSWEPPGCVRIVSWLSNIRLYLQHIFLFRWTHLPSSYLIITDSELASNHSLIILIQTLQPSDCPPTVSLFLPNERAILRKVRTTELPFFCGFSNVQTPLLQEVQRLVVWLFCTTPQKDSNFEKELACEKGRKRRNLLVWKYKD